MIGPGTHWRRPPSGMPPWVAAILTVTGILLMIQALPMLAAAITPDRSSFSMSSASAPEPPVPLPLSPQPGANRAVAGAEAGAPSDTKGRDVTSSGGDTPPRGPLPIAGGTSLAPLAIGVVLLGGGLGLLTMVGFSGGRPWPGRYVRRDR